MQQKKPAGGRAALLGAVTVLILTAAGNLGYAIWQIVQGTGSFTIPLIAGTICAGLALMLLLAFRQSGRQR
jgi:hypothetical protein